MKINSLKRSHIWEIQPISILRQVRDNNGKIKAQKLPVKELLKNVRNAIKPQSSSENDIERLIKELLWNQTFIILYCKLFYL